MGVYFPEELGETPEERRRARDEFLDIAEDAQIAEGDITVSETETGHDPMPDLDDDPPDVQDNLTVLDEDDPELAFNYDEKDDYLDDEHV